MAKIKKQRLTKTGLLYQKPGPKCEQKKSFIIGFRLTPDQYRALHLKAYRTLKMKPNEAARVKILEWISDISTPSKNKREAMPTAAKKWDDYLKGT